MANSERLAELAAGIKRHKVAVGSVGLAYIAAAAAVFSGCGPRNSGETSQTPQVDIPTPTETVTPPWATATIEDFTATPLTSTETPTPISSPVPTETVLTPELPQINYDNYLSFLEGNFEHTWERRVDEQKPYLYVVEDSAGNQYGFNLVENSGANDEKVYTSVADFLKRQFPDGAHPGDKNKVLAVLAATRAGNGVDKVLFGFDGQEAQVKIDPDAPYGVLVEAWVIGARVCKPGELPTDKQVDKVGMLVILPPYHPDSEENDKPIKTPFRNPAGISYSPAQCDVIPE